MRCFILYRCNAGSKFSNNACSVRMDDVIANGIGSSYDSVSNDIDGVGYAFVATDFKAVSSDPPLAFGIPVNGIINSVVASTPGLSYQLGDLNSNNSLRLETAGQNGTLVFITPLAALKLYMLATSGSGAATVMATVTFTDNTSQVFSNISIPDWYGGSNYAVQGLGRVVVGIDDIEADSFNPRIYQFALNMDTANQSKSVKSVTLTKSGGDGIVNLFAFSADKNTQLSTAEVNGFKKGDIYPNPFKDVFHINDIKNVKSITVSDVAGREVKAIDKPSTVLQLGELNAGLYLVTMNFKDGSKSTVKAIKK
ncbi:T9SS type A sorting domain-containing protein [Chryseobacterium sp. RU33C]|uniref:T9SS type A sorting domain-containing protein n=1 Tax=Chryseobacterium sp. RU33C TaxID=1907398 RepID=UPI0009569052|nr:T9SS type A sorting domain-containing protein [Chryseobacterium sp. RU33C]SIQ66306.1 Por secretion system C-terminal sorting domain-containing protein [Chryseobacterium sp. RU33C]